MGTKARINTNYSFFLVAIFKCQYMSVSKQLKGFTLYFYHFYVHKMLILAVL